MRGSSSPVEVKRAREEDISSAAARRPVTPPAVVKKEAEDRDLEEGEVVSPVKRTGRDPWRNADEAPRDGGRRNPHHYNRLSYDTGYRRNMDAVSPRKLLRSRTPPIRSVGHVGRSTEDLWASQNRRRSASSPVDLRRMTSAGETPRSKSPRLAPLSDMPAVESIEEEAKHDPTAEPERPATPSDPPPAEKVKAGLTIKVYPRGSSADVTPEINVCRTGTSATISRPDTPLYPPPTEEPSKSENSGSAILEIFRPDTPAFPPSEEAERTAATATVLTVSSGGSNTATSDLTSAATSDLTSAATSDVAITATSETAITVYPDVAATLSPDNDRLSNGSHISAADQTRPVTLAVSEDEISASGMAEVSAQNSAEISVMSEIRPATEVKEVGADLGVDHALLPTVDANTPLSTTPPSFNEPSADLPHLHETEDSVPIVSVSEKAGAIPEDTVSAEVPRQKSTSLPPPVPSSLSGSLNTPNIGEGGQVERLEVVISVTY